MGSHHAWMCFCLKIKILDFQLSLVTNCKEKKSMILLSCHINDGKTIT